jgi:CRISPR-associated protein Cas1
MLKGRLGLETARVPHADRHGLLWLGRGHLSVDAGSLRFVTAGDEDWPRGDHSIPFQMISCILMQPGTTVSHDALRLLARHGTGLLAVGEGGVRLYASMPFGPGDSQRARKQVQAWADERKRSKIVRRMYAWRLGEVLPDSEIAVLRGIEGARAKQMYSNLAQRFGIPWSGRRYDRQNPEQNDLVNQAINHAASAVEGAAMVAVAVAGAIPSLGFIHEDSGHAFTLDIADLFRDEITLPVAFGAVRGADLRTIERAVRKLAATTFRKQQVIARMIDRIKELFDADDGGGHAKRGGADPGVPGVVHE